MNIGDVGEVQVTGIGRVSNAVQEAPSPTHKVGTSRRTAKQYAASRWHSFNGAPSQPVLLRSMRLPVRIESKNAANNLFAGYDVFDRLSVH